MGCHKSRFDTNFATLTSVILPQNVVKLNQNGCILAGNVCEIYSTTTFVAAHFKTIKQFIFFGFNISPESYSKNYETLKKLAILKRLLLIQLIFLFFS